MKGNLAIVAGLALLILAIIYIEEQRKKELLEREAALKNKNQFLERQNAFFYSKLQELENFIDSVDGIDNSLKSKLHEIIAGKDVDEATFHEIQSAISMLEQNYPEKAAFSIAKTVEGLLKTKYKDTPKFINYMNTKKKKAAKATFHDYLEFVKDTGIIDKDEYYFAKGLKESRNKEAHEVGNGFLRDKSVFQTAAFVGTELIIKLCQVEKA